jgi:hypothetical protein
MNRNQILAVPESKFMYDKYYIACNFYTLQITKQGIAYMFEPL